MNVQVFIKDYFDKKNIFLTKIIYSGRIRFCSVQSVSRWDLFEIFPNLYN